MCVCEEILELNWLHNKFATLVYSSVHCLLIKKTQPEFYYVVIVHNVTWMKNFLTDCFSFKNEYEHALWTSFCLTFSCLTCRPSG